MRLLAFAILLLPFMGFAEPICPVGYGLNAQGLCSQKWRILQGSCASSHYLDVRSKECRPRCPYRSQEETSELGDRVCQMDGKREWMDFFRKNCAKAKMRYQPQIHQCVADTLLSESEEESEQCGPGKVARVEEDRFFCVPGNPQQVLKKMQEKLESEGLSYTEYLETMKDIQTTRFGAEVMRDQWEIATGKQPKPATKAAAPASNCPEGYAPNEIGGCRPAKSCSSYGCPNGKPANLISDGRNQYCGC